MMRARGIQFHYQTYDGQFFAILAPIPTLAGLFDLYYETGERNMLPYVFGEGDRVLDCGAGIGFTTAVIAMRAEFVLGIEALPESCAVAKENCMSYKNVEVLEGMLIPDGKRLSFAKRDLVFTSGFCGDDEEPMKIQPSPYGVNKTVAAYKLNGLQLDMEGGELEIIRALDFAPIRKLSLETHPDVYGRAGENEIFQILRSAGLPPLIMNQPKAAEHEQSYCLAFARPEIAREMWKRRIGRDNLYWTVPDGKDFILTRGGDAGS